MATFTETFTRSNGDLNNNNGWTTYTSAGSNTTGQWQIVSDQAEAEVDMSYMVQNLGQQKFPYSLSINIGNVGTGAAYAYNNVVLGSNNLTSYTNFENNGINIYLSRSDAITSNSTLYIYDGSSLVESGNPTWQYVGNGSYLTLNLTMNSDGSGSLEVVQGTNNFTITWTARTWTNGTGNYFGIVGHNGTDGTGATNITSADTISYTYVNSVASTTNASFLLNFV